MQNDQAFSLLLRKILQALREIKLFGNKELLAESSDL